MLKVNARGIQGDAARWIRNSLAGRRQRVCINQYYGNWAPVTSGVPQDSHAVVPNLWSADPWGSAKVILGVREGSTGGPRIKFKIKKKNNNNAIKHRLHKIYMHSFNNVRSKRFLIDFFFFF